MGNGPALGGDSPGDARNASQLLNGWRHLQKSLGVSLFQSVKRSRKLAQSNLRRKGR